MTCRDVLAFLADYLDDALDNATRLTFEHHLALCSSCTAYLASYRETIRLARAAGLFDEPPDDVPQELIEAVRASIRKP